MFGHTRASPIAGISPPVLCLFLLGAIATGLWSYNRPGQARPPAKATPINVSKPGVSVLKQLPARPEDIASQTLEPLAPEAARKVNASFPLPDQPPLPARPFLFRGSALDRDRAADCLAIAALAEAGGSDAGQRAVIQVVLNRVRHPAFAKTICGVVFQGSERTTGCQFTFTCDGSLARRYSSAAWAAAKKRAEAALDGRVFAPVGSATHYHTDWVHPVWSSQLSKIARVDTHLFFRWPGYWGSRDAARSPYRGAEPAIRLLPWINSHSVPGAGTDLAVAAAAVPVRSAGDRIGIGEIVASHPSGRAFLIHLASRPSAASALTVGRELCGEQGFCRVLAWTERAAIPSGFPLPQESQAKASFSYVLDLTNAEHAFYDCKVFRKIPPAHCMPSSLL